MKLCLHTADEGTIALCVTRSNSDARQQYNYHNALDRLSICVCQCVYFTQTLYRYRLCSLSFTSFFIFSMNFTQQSCTHVIDFIEKNGRQ